MEQDSLTRGVRLTVGLLPCTQEIGVQFSDAPLGLSRFYARKTPKPGCIRELTTPGPDGIGYPSAGIVLPTFGSSLMVKQRPLKAYLKVRVLLPEPRKLGVKVAAPALEAGVRKGVRVRLS